MSYVCPTWKLEADTNLKSAAPSKQGSPLHWKFCKVHTDPHFVKHFDPSDRYDYIIKLFRQEAEVVQNHENEQVRSIG
jgi:hypothetical protein